MAEAQRAEAALAQSVTQMLGSDLRVATEDYKLLQRLNEAATRKYEDMETVVGVRPWRMARQKLWVFVR